MTHRKKETGPDYEAWQKLPSELIGLPTIRFYFVVTMLVMAAVAYGVSGSLAALTVVMGMMLAFALGVIWSHQWEESNETKKQNCSVESTDDARAAGETRKVDGGLGLGKHDGHGSSGPSGLRAPLESQEKEAATNRPR